MHIYAQTGQRLADVCITHFNVHTHTQVSLFESSKCDVPTQTHSVMKAVLSVPLG